MSVDIKEFESEEYIPELIGVAIGKTKGEAVITYTFLKVTRIHDGGKRKEDFFDVFVNEKRKGTENKYAYYIFNQLQLDSLMIDVKELSERRFYVCKRVLEYEYFECLGEMLLCKADEKQIQLEGDGTVYFDDIDTFFNEASYNEFAENMGELIAKKGLFDE